MSVSKCAKYLCLTSFALLFVLGGAIFADYGVGWDEFRNIDLGIITFDTIFLGKPYLFKLEPGGPYSHGPFFQTLTHVATKIFCVDSWELYLRVKHFMVFFLYFISIYFYYRLCRKFFHNDLWAYMCCVFMVLHPHIFANSFFNIRDIPFLSLFIISMFTMTWYLENFSWLRAIVHGLITAFCISTRIVGLYVPILTLLFAGINFLVRMKQINFIAKFFSSTLIYSLTFILTTVAIWPIFWNNPIKVFITFLKVTVNLPTSLQVLYFGEFVSSVSLPWHYAPVWIGITSPISVVIMFLFGLACLPTNLRKFINGQNSEDSLALLPYVWAFSVLAPIMFFGSTLYDGWRHMFFIYPAVVMIAVNGFQWFWNKLYAMPIRIIPNLVMTIITVLVALNITDTVFFMIRNHPHQNVYFNELVGGVKGADGKFEMDYWGLSYKQLYEKLLKQVGPQDPVFVNGYHRPARDNIKILTPEQKNRISWVDGQPPQGRPYYFLTNFRWHPEHRTVDAPQAAQITVDGVPIAVAYYRRNGLDEVALSIQRDVDGNEMIKAPDGKVFSIRNEAFEGLLEQFSIEGNRVVLVGWGADQKRKVPPSDFALFLGDKCLGVVRPTNRPDLANYFGDPQMDKIGFAVELPLSSLKGKPFRQFRILALTADWLAGDVSIQKANDEENKTIWGEE